MITENLATLKIHRLSNVQYEREVANGNIDETAFYLTPDEFVEDETHPGCYYRMVGEEKEWVNPPLITGEEYRTIERWNGFPVYVKNVPMGSGPAEGTTIGMDVLDAYAYPVRAVGRAVELSGHTEIITLPYRTLTKDFSIQPVVSEDRNLSVVVIALKGSLSGYACFAQVWYYKE